MFTQPMGDRDDAWRMRGLTCLLHRALYQWNMRLTCRGYAHERVFDGHQLWRLFERRGWDDRMAAVSR